MLKGIIDTEAKQSVKPLYTYIYTGLMFLLYAGFALLDSYRIHRGESWLSKKNLTQEEFQRIDHLGIWQGRIEWVFLSLFLVAAALAIVRYRIKNDGFPLKRFLLVHLCLFILLLAFSYTFSVVSPSPLGNVIQPLLEAILLFGIMMLYPLYRMLMKRQRNN
ncbi:hypothetical protein [Bacillus sp. 1P06AnD]|uniref:hypothetical protein n=1 Tax=Bacillus sp. 1P06AnD TaxID=3132208 RepID=UPI0039A04967